MAEYILPSKPVIGSSSASAENRAKWIMTRLKMVVSAYRKDDFADPESWSLQAARLLESFSNTVVTQSTDPLSGIQSHKTFPPSLAELREFCEDINRRSSYAKTWNDQAIKQLNERESEYETPEQRRQIAERIMHELGAAMAAPPPPDSYAAMFAKHGRPRGPFEKYLPTKQKS